MTRWITAIVLVCGTLLAAPQPPVTFDLPCECQGNHGEHRWSVKTDSSLPPTDASAIQSVTPSDVYGWPGMAVHLTMQSERTGIENNWYALTGRVVAAIVEADGDLHIALQDATGDKAGIVVCEIPVGPRGNRWVLPVFGVIGLLNAYLPAYTDRKELWTNRW